MTGVPRLASAQFANDFGTWFGRLAVITALAHQSPRLAALVIVADTLPRALAGPVLARFGPRLSPLRMAAICCLAEASALVVAAGWHAVAAVVIAVFAVRAVFDAALVVTIQSAVARLPLPREELLRANFRMSLTSSLAMLIAPVTAGVLNATSTVATMLLVDAASYVVVLILASGPLRLVAPRNPESRPVAAGTEIPRPARPLLLSSGLATLAGGCFNAFLPVLFLEVLRGSGRDLGLALTLFGAGTLAVNLLGSTTRALRAGGSLLVSLAGGGLLLVVLAIAPTLIAAWVIVALFGGVVALRATSTRHLVQLAGGAQPFALVARWQAVNNAGLLAGSLAALVLADPGLIRSGLVALGLVYLGGMVPLLTRRLAAEPVGVSR